MSKKSLQQIAFVGGSFVLTLALLLAVWMFAFAPVPRAAPVLTPTPAPTLVQATPIGGLPTPGPGASVAPPTNGPAASRTPFNPWGSMAPPLRTPVPSTGPRESTIPGQAQVFVVNGADYVDASIPDEAELDRNGDSVTLITTRGSSDALWVTWRLDDEVLPAGAVIHDVAVRICGDGSGDFWEVYGPDGGSPFEYEVQPPQADGCWHFTGAPGHDLSVVGGTMLESEMTITHLEFAITFAAGSGSEVPLPQSTTAPIATPTPGA